LTPVTLVVQVRLPCNLCPCLAVHPHQLFPNGPLPLPCSSPGQQQPPMHQRLSTLQQGTAQMTCALQGSIVPK
jgi:hypothetical protein